jgi:hypothetical protein
MDNNNGEKFSTPPHFLEVLRSIQACQNLLNLSASSAMLNKYFDQFIYGSGSGRKNRCGSGSSYYPE